MHQQTVYITYDLPQGGESSQVLRRALSQTILGHVVRSQIGEFKMASGQVVSGVRLSVVLEDEENLEKEVIEVPAHAQNVQVHLDQLPDIYRSALDSAA